MHCYRDSSDRRAAGGTAASKRNGVRTMETKKLSSLSFLIFFVSYAI